MHRQALAGIQRTGGTAELIDVARPVGGADKRVVADKRGMRQPCGGSVLEATLERITFANPDTGYTVAPGGQRNTRPHCEELWRSTGPRER